MHGTTKEIQTLLNSEEFSSLDEISQVSIAHNYPQEHNEFSLAEAQVAIENTRDLILNAIDSGLLDKYSLQTRNNLKSHVTNVKQNIQVIIKSKQNKLPQLLDSVQNLREYASVSMSLPSQARRLFHYNQKMKDLENLQVSYRENVNELKEAIRVRDEILKSVKVMEEGSIKSKELLDQFLSIDGDISNIKDAIEKQHKEIEEGSIEVKNQFDEINKFFADIENNKKILDETIAASKKIITEHEELHGDVKKLVESATGGALGKDFGERKKDLTWPVRFWLTASLASMGAIVWATFKLVSVLSDDELSLIAGRVMILLAIGTLTWFTSSHYTKNRDLLEEYAFKSTMALTLSPTIKVITENITEEGEERAAVFLKESLDKLYSAPLDNINRREAELKKCKAKREKDDSLKLSTEQLKDIAEKIVKLTKT